MTNFPSYAILVRKFNRPLLFAVLTIHGPGNGGNREYHGEITVLF
jgi:hypothetical protein